VARQDGPFATPLRASDGAEASRVSQRAPALARRSHAAAVSPGPTAAVILVLAAGLALALAALVADAVVALGRLPTGALARSRIVVAGLGLATATVALAVLLVAS
jgi:hypothetical protein